MSEERKQEQAFAARLAAQVAARFAAIAPPPAMGPEAEAEAVERAWTRLCARRAAHATPRTWSLLARPAWLGAAACALLVGTLGLSPAARSATARVLSLFRIQQVAALPVDLTSNSPLANRSTASMIQRMIADELTITLNEKNQLVPSGGAAAQMAGFSLRYPLSLPAPQFFVEGAKDFTLTVDRNRAQSILDAADVTGVNLPQGLDGATMSVHIPRAVGVLYGDCARWLQRNATGLPSAPTSGACTVIGEGPSPTASLPPGLDMATIAAAGLQMTGMSASAAQQFCSTIDWTSTLVVPFPRNAANSRDVAVDGASGILLTTSATARQPQYVLLWTRGGMLYSIAGPGDGSQGLTLAAELPPA